MIRLLIILLFSICISNELEKLTYEVYFNNLKAGTASLKLSEDANQENYVLNFELRSHKYLDAIYKLRENTSMIIDRKDFFIYEINKYVRQGRKKRNYQAIFNYDTKIAHINNKITTFQKPIYDPINIIYYLRNNFQLLKNNMSFSIITKNTFKTIHMGIINEEEIISVKDKIGLPLVLKADGLAAGKGVIICNNDNELYEAIDIMVSKKKFGEAANKISVEECIKGEELSVFAICDGENYQFINSAQDHKRVFNDDKGPNTGGMGAYSPTPLYNENIKEKGN